MLNPYVIGSLLWVPIAANECTTNQCRVSYARVLIAVDESKPLPKAILVEDEEGHVHVQSLLIEWVPHLCLVLGRVCVESNQAPKDRQAEKAIKKGTTVMPSVPKQGTIEQTMGTGMAGRRTLGETSNEEEREWVQVNKKKSQRVKRFCIEVESSSDTQPRRMLG